MIFDITRRGVLKSRLFVRVSRVGIAVRCQIRIDDFHSSGIQNNRTTSNERNYFVRVRRSTACLVAIFSVKWNYSLQAENLLPDVTFTCVRRNCKARIYDFSHLPNIGRCRFCVSVLFRAFVWNVGFVWHFFFFVCCTFLFFFFFFKSISYRELALTKWKLFYFWEKIKKNFHSRLYTISHRKHNMTNVLVWLTFKDVRFLIYTLINIRVVTYRSGKYNKFPKCSTVDWHKC